MAKIDSFRKNNTAGLQFQISGLIAKSDLWLVLRRDNDGIHLHMPNVDHISLLAAFLAQQPEILEMVNEFAAQVRSK